MKTTHHVSVTAEHVARGERYCSTGCPVALAVSEVLGRAVHVALGGVWTTSGAEPKLAVLPPEVGRKIDEFDTTGTCVPFEFDLEVNQP